jgi:transcriptional regulator with XRE-family HTH domain
VLRALRLEGKLSMKKAATIIGISDSTSAHIETGRMNPPKNAKLEKFLKAYVGYQDEELLRTGQNI